MIFLRRKSKKSTLIIVVCSFCISLIFALIHTAFTINIIITIFGLTVSFSGLFLEIRNRIIHKNQLILAPTKQIITTQSRTVNTNSGNYNESIGRDYIHDNSVTNNIKNITIGNRKVKINSNEIVDTFDEFRNILTQSINQNSNALEAISDFAKELTEELRNRPDVKACFGVDENISEQEFLNKIFIDLLTNNYDNFNKTAHSHKITPITQPTQIQRINISNNSEFIEHFQDCGNNEYDVSYKGYIIHLFQEKFKRWLYRIRRSDSSIFEHGNIRHSRNIYFAIGRAVDQIDDEIDINWKNSMSNTE